MELIAALSLSDQKQGVDAFVETFKGATWDDPTRPSGFVAATERFKHNYREATAYYPLAGRTFAEWIRVFYQWAKFDELFDEIGIPYNARNAVWAKQAADAQQFRGAVPPAQLLGNVLADFVQAHA